MQSIAARYRARYYPSTARKPRRHRAELQPTVSADRRAHQGVPCGGAVHKDHRRTARNLRFTSKSAFRVGWQVWRAARRTRRLFWRALNALHTASLDRHELCEMGLKLGADVPFCLRGGTMLAQGIGEELSLLSGYAAPGWVDCVSRLRCRPFKEVHQETDSGDILEHPDNKGAMAALDQEIDEGACAYRPTMETVTQANAVRSAKSSFPQQKTVRTVR